MGKHSTSVNGGGNSNFSSEKGGFTRSSTSVGAWIAWSSSTGKAFDAAKNNINDSVANVIERLTNLVKGNGSAIELDKGKAVSQSRWKERKSYRSGEKVGDETRVESKMKVLFYSFSKLQELEMKAKSSKD